MAEKEYIEREALLKVVEERLDTLRKEYGDFDHYTDGYDECVDRISEAPPAEVVEVRHGCWIDNNNGTFTCSVCGGRASKMAWCGRCGAMMDRRKEDEGK